MVVSAGWIEIMRADTYILTGWGSDYDGEEITVEQRLTLSQLCDRYGLMDYDRCLAVVLDCAHGCGERLHRELPGAERHNRIEIR